MNVEFAKCAIDSLNRATAVSASPLGSALISGGRRSPIVFMLFQLAHAFIAS